MPSAPRPTRVSSIPPPARSMAWTRACCGSVTNRRVSVLLSASCEGTPLGSRKTRSMLRESRLNSARLAHFGGDVEERARARHGQPAQAAVGRQVDAVDLAPVLGRDHRQRAEAVAVALGVGDEQEAAVRAGHDRARRPADAGVGEGAAGLRIDEDDRRFPSAVTAMTPSRAPTSRGSSGLRSMPEVSAPPGGDCMSSSLPGIGWSSPVAQPPTARTRARARSRPIGMKHGGRSWRPV